MSSDEGDDESRLANTVDCVCATVILQHGDEPGVFERLLAHNGRAHNGNHFCVKERAASAHADGRTCRFVVTRAVVNAECDACDDKFCESGDVSIDVTTMPYTTPSTASIPDLISSSTHVITHCGAGSIMECYNVPGKERRRTLVAVNTTLMGNHQADLASKVEDLGFVLLNSKSAAGGSVEDDGDCFSSAFDAAKENWWCAPPKNDALVRFQGREDFTALFKSLSEVCDRERRRRGDAYNQGLQCALL